MASDAEPLIVVPEEFPEFLRTQMGERSAAEYAKHLKISVKLLYMLLNGTRTPSTSVRKKLRIRTVYVMVASLPKAKAGIRRKV